VSSSTSNSEIPGLRDIALLLLNLAIVSSWLASWQDMAWLLGWIAVDRLFNLLRHRIEHNSVRPHLGRIAFVMHLLFLIAAWAGLKKVEHLLGGSYLFLKLVYQACEFSRRPSPSRLVPTLNALIFAPSFLAGPIFRPEDIAAQPLRPTRASLRFALERITWGILKLHVLAVLLNNVSIYRWYYPASLESLSPEVAIGGLYAGGLWLYFNFAGYSDLAIGFAALCGIRLPENFNHPLIATNIGEFWRRWHMSFSDWLRAMIFHPLTRCLGSGEKPSVAARTIPFAATMIACGLWHHAHLNLFLWGLYHAAGLILQNEWRSFRERAFPALERGRVYRAACWLLTFHFVMAGWLLFFNLHADFLRAVISWLS
jgi:alginate O-acetyltransferase complex protein AlgI